MMNAPILECADCGHGLTCPCGKRTNSALAPPPYARSDRSRVPVPAGPFSRLAASLRAILKGFRGRSGRGVDAAGDSAPGLNRPLLVLAGLRGQNEPAEFMGREGFWVQADCVFVPARDASGAITEYQRMFREGGGIACSHNRFCGSILREKERSKCRTEHRLR